MFNDRIFGSLMPCNGAFRGWPSREEKEIARTLASPLGDVEMRAG